MSDTSMDPNPIADLRSAVDRSNARVAELEPLAKENAFLKAGITGYDGPDANPVAALLYSSYDGELTTDAIRERALTLGVIQPPSPPPDTTATPDEQQQTRERLGLGNDTLPPEGLDTSTTLKDAMDERAQLLRNGKSEQSASLPVIGHLMVDAANGGPAAWSAESWKREVQTNGDLDDLL